MGREQPWHGIGTGRNQVTREHGRDGNRSENGERDRQDGAGGDRTKSDKAREGLDGCDGRPAVMSHPTLSK